MTDIDIILDGYLEIQDIVLGYLRNKIDSKESDESYALKSMEQIKNLFLSEKYSKIIRGLK